MPPSLAQEFEGWMKSSFFGDIDKSSAQFADSRWAFYAGCLVAYSSRADFLPELRAFHRELKAMATAKTVIH